ncbi:diacylglycerol kinase [Salinithrix halophila]|uniref:Diacylglycerol kinase n=1 Tax=Salinithrix halophila TaxID=1485204 RepID=A0ABV8JE71_9BACL
MWLSKLLASFRFALEGLKYTLVSQRNMRIHFLAALAVLLLSLYLPLTKAEVLILFVTILLVIVAELINTAVEAVIDMVTEEFHPLAKVAKDVAAGAVLLCSGMAVVVGVSVFYPYLDLLSFHTFEGAPYPPNIGLAALIAFNFFLTLLMKSLFHRIGRYDWEPSMTTSLASCIAASLVIMVGNLLVTLLVILLTALLLGTRLRIKTRKNPVILGAILGVLVAVIGFQLM